MTLPEYRILAVCTGNICRSPTIERLLVARLRRSLGESAAARFAVGSAGTWGLVGEPMTPEAQQLLRQLGGDPTGFAAREITPALVETADLVLTATREHRAATATLVPRASSRTLTLRELARLLAPVAATSIEASDPVARMSALVVTAVGNRGLVPLDDPREDDIADPYGLALASYERAAGQIDAAIQVLLDRLSPPASRS